MLKKSVSFIMIIFLLFSLAACKSEKTTGAVSTKIQTQNSEDVGVTEISELSSEINPTEETGIATEKSADSTEKKTEKTERTEKTIKQSKTAAKASVKLSKSDKQNLIYTLDYIIGFGSDYKMSGYNVGDVIYNSKSKTALKDAIGLSTALFYSSLFDDLCWRKAYDYSGKDNEEGDMHYNVVGQDYIPDPLKMFQSARCPYDYNTLSAKEFDKILKYIFGVTPDHSYVFKGRYSDYLEHIVYCYDENYYYTRADGGDGAGPDTRIEKAEKTSDGRYLVQVGEYWGNDFDGYSKMGRFSVECKITPVNGVRYWTINIITKTG